jgi:hypothetical protein
MRMTILIPGTWRTQVAYMTPFVTMGVTLLIIVIAWPRFWLYIDTDDTTMDHHQLLLAAAIVAVVYDPSWCAWCMTNAT